MNIKPLFDRVLLTPYQKQSKSGLIATNEYEGEQMLVISVGNETTTIKKDNIVLINKFAGSEFTIDNKKFILIKECDILAILEEKTNE